MIGRVRKPHGVHGELKVESLSGELDHFKRLTVLILQQGDRRVEVSIERLRTASGLALIKLVGVDTPEVAKQWRGWDVVVSRELAAPLGEGEFYYADLVGLSVQIAGKSVATILNVLDGGPWPFLEVETHQGEKRIVPFEEHFVGAIDLEGASLELLDAEVLE